MAELLVSFSLNLFPNGFSIGKPTEDMLLTLVRDLPKSLHPYDRASKSLFSAIENGWLPGEILDDLPCKYLNGTIMCEVCDYRSIMSGDSKLDSNGTSEVFPKVQKVHLRMGTETVVKDMPLISDDAWTYNDLLQAESRIIKALQPVLYLEPKPSLDRLCRAPVLKQLDLGTYGTALKGKHHIGQDAEFKYSRQSDMTDALGNASAGNLKTQPSDAPEGEAKYPTQSPPRSMPNVESTKYGIEQASPLAYLHGSVINDPFPSPNAGRVSSIITARDEVLRGSCIGQKDPADFPLAKSDKLIPGVPCLKPTLKRPKQELQDFDTHQIVSIKKAKHLEPDLERKIAALCEPGESQDFRNSLCSRSDNYTHPQVMNEVSGEKLVPDGRNPIPLCLRDVPNSIVKQPFEFETKNIVKSEHLNGTNEKVLSVRNSKPSPNLPLASMKPLPPQMYWMNASSFIEKPPKNETASRKKKKAVGACQVSTGCSLNSQVSRAGGKQMNVIKVSHIRREDASPIETSKGNVTSVPVISNGNAFTNPSSTKSLISASQTPSRAKKISRSNCKNPVTSGNAFGGAVNEAEIPNYSKNVLVRTPSLQFLPEIDSVRAICMNFSRIEVVAKRHGLNKRKVKNDKILKTRSLPDPRIPQCCLIMDKNTEDFIAFAEKKCMSKSIIGGSRNTCKIRILSYRRVRVFFRADGMPIFVDDSWSKLVLHESDVPDIHKVAAEMLYGDNEQSIHLAYLPTTHHADLYASQFTSLMVREGFELLDDQVRFQPSATPASTSNSQMGSHGPAELPSAGHFPNQSAETTSTTNSIPTLKRLGYPSQNNPSPMCLNLTRPIKLEIAPELSCLPMHQSLNQRFLPILPKSTLDATTVPMLDQLPNNPRLQHLNLQQFQQQYQQQSIIQQTMPGNNLGGHFFTSDDQRVTEFCSSNNQQISRGVSAIQATVLARLNRSQSVGTGAIEGGPRMSPSGGTIWTNNGSPLSPALDMSSSNQNQFRTRTPSNLCSNYDLLHQHQAQQARLQQPEDWQPRQQLLPQQYSSPAATQMSQCTPNSPMQFSSGSAPQQANAGVSVASSPQMSVQTVGSGGSVTSAPMGLKGVGKGCSSGVGKNMRQ
ncbi:putative transcription factor Spt20 [Dioscorea sansibarensis]